MIPGKSLLITVFALLVPFTASAGEYLVKYRHSSELMLVESIGAHALAGTTIKDINSAGRYAVLEIPDDKSVMMRAQLAMDSNVEWIQPNIRFEAVTSIPAKSPSRDQWALTQVRAPEAWAMAGNGGFWKVTVAVIDTGVDYRHKNLSRNMVAGYDFFDNDNDPDDGVSFLNAGHGTHCAGIIAADGQVDGGVSGISPNSSVMPLRFIGPDNTGDLNSAIKAIDFAAAHGVQVVSASWNKKESPDVVQGLLEAVQRAEAQGVVFVFTAGNENADNDKQDIFPANLGTPNSITVTGSDENDVKIPTSSYGMASVHIAAPGSAVVSTLPKNNYGVMTGTSEATPLVAGAIALLKSQDSSLTGAELRALLQTTGMPVNIDVACHCRLDVAKAMEFLLHKEPWIVPAANTIGVGDDFKTHIVNASGAYRYASSDEGVMHVEDDGTVHGVGVGSARMTAISADGRVIGSLDYRVVLSKRCAVQVKSVCLLNRIPQIH